jgi:hypothetical protein
VAYGSGGPPYLAIIAEHHSQRSVRLTGLDTYLHIRPLEPWARATGAEGQPVRSPDCVSADGVLVSRQR